MTAEEVADLTAAQLAILQQRAGKDPNTESFRAELRVWNTMTRAQRLAYVQEIANG